jgi:hypothetical protein
MLHAQNLSDYQWKNRLVILVDEGLKTDAIRSQFKAFVSKPDELVERDILLFLLTPKTIVLSNGENAELSVNDAYSSLSIPKNFKGVLLIGKDGGIKLKKPFEVTTADIFTLIDGMPMRKSEIRKHQGS